MAAYEKRVAANLAQMNAPEEEWSAVEILGEQKAEDGSGRERSMPVFDFPKGYEAAPSLCRSCAGNCCCNLCGADIKNLFWIKNDSKKLIMEVGSECVERFGAGLSGERLLKEAVWDANRQTLTDLIGLRKELFQEFPKNARGLVESFAVQASELRVEIRNLVGVLEPDSPNASITRWIGKNADAAAELDGQGKRLIGIHKLAAAAAARDEESIDRLLAGGADLDARDRRDRTALHFLIVQPRESHAPAVDALLRKGVNPSVPDSEGRSPLMWAAIFGKADVCKLLLDSGADVHAVDQRGRTALDCAEGETARAVIEERMRRPEKDPEIIAAFLRLPEDQRELVAGQIGSEAAAALKEAGKALGETQAQQSPKAPGANRQLNLGF